MRGNSAFLSMWIWVFITLIFIFGIFIPSIFGIEGFYGGYAISFFCIILTLTGIVVIVIYYSRARNLEKILHYKNLLVHWTYTPHQWQEYTEKDYSAQKSERWSLYGLVMIIVVIVCFGFWLFNRDSGALMIIITFGLGVLLAGTVFFTTIYDHWQNKRCKGEVYITKNGVLVNKSLHLWHGWGASLERVEYKKQDQIIEIAYSTPNRGTRNTFTVRIPVPPGQEVKASQVIEKIAPSAKVLSDDI
jgi:hypothetical protein